MSSESLFKEGDFCNANWTARRRFKKVDELGVEKYDFVTTKPSKGTPGWTDGTYRVVGITNSGRLRLGWPQSGGYVRSISPNAGNIRISKPER